jgi:hypothetical protein
VKDLFASLGLKAPKLFVIELDNDGILYFLLSLSLTPHAPPTSLIPPHSTTYYLFPLDLSPSIPIASLFSLLSFRYSNHWLFSPSSTQQMEVRSNKAWRIWLVSQPFLMCSLVESTWVDVIVCPSLSSFRFCFRFLVYLSNLINRHNETKIRR